jgi:hypothetical protein
MVVVLKGKIAYDWFLSFAFWGLQKEFSTLPCSPCFTS